MHNPIYSGKVRNVYRYDNDKIIIVATDKLSAFNRHQCLIPNKGQYLTKMSKWWFNETRDIIPNHYICSKGQYMLVKKCEPIKLEIIVRDYITGSLWKAYKNGEKKMYGITFPDGLEYNQKINTIITPTLKNDNDDPTSEQEILEKNILTKEEWEYIKTKSLELFKRGSIISKANDLVLVDTKYEFGYDKDRNIILIDEIHTCDSSRYWNNNSSFDKDIVRKWIELHPNQKIPMDIIIDLGNVYKNYALSLIDKDEDLELEMTSLFQFIKDYESKALLC